jgi:hypothetical protein
VKRGGYEHSDSMFSAITHRARLSFIAVDTFHGTGVHAFTLRALPTARL